MKSVIQNVIIMKLLWAKTVLVPRILNVWDKMGFSYRPEQSLQIEIASFCLLGCHVAILCHIVTPQSQGLVLYCTV